MPQSCSLGFVVNPAHYFFPFASAAGFPAATKSVIASV
jgi:hypothetical protein